MYKKIDFNYEHSLKIFDKNIVFFVSLILMLFSSSLNQTMFPISYAFIRTACNWTLFLALILMIFKIVFLDKRNIKMLILILIVGFILGFSAKLSKDHVIFNAYIMILGSFGIDLKKIFKCFFIVMTIVILGTFIGCYFNLIPNLAYFRNGFYRYALGESYPTILTSIFFYICVAIVCINIKTKNKVIILFEMLFVIFFSLFGFFVANSRNDLICSMMLLLVIPWMYYEKFLNNKFIKMIICAVPTLIFSWTAFSAFAYDSKNGIWIFINNLLSGRLELVHKASINYPLKAYGQYIRQEGNGGSIKPVINYFFIDSSFSRVLFMQGVLIFILIYIVFQLSYYYILKDNNIYNKALLLVLSFAMIEGTICNIFFDVGLNVSLFILVLALKKERDIYD